MGPILGGVVEVVGKVLLVRRRGWGGGRWWRRGRDRRRGRVRRGRWPRLRYGGGAPPGGDGAYAPASLAALGATCRAAAAQRGAPLLLLHGIDPLGDVVVDSARPLPPRASAEFVSVLSGRAVEQALAPDCAGTQAWRALSKRCSFYFLRERDAVSRQTHRSVSLSFPD